METNAQFALFDIDTGPHPLQRGAPGRGRRALHGRASPGVLGGRTGLNTNTCQPEEGNKGENVAPRPRPVGSICSSQDFAFVQSRNNG